MAEVDDRTRQWTSKKGGTHGVEYYRELGKIVWEYCGMARNENLEGALGDPRREEFRKNVKVLGSPDGINTMLEKVNRVDDFMEFAELKVRDALHRGETGGHFREESQTEEGEALRDDENFAYVGAGNGTGPTRPRPSTRKTLSSNTSS